VKYLCQSPRPLKSLVGHLDTLIKTPGAAIWEATKVTVPIALGLQIDVCWLVKFHCACPALVWICHLTVGVRCRAAQSVCSHAVELLSKLAIYVSQNRNSASCGKVIAYLQICLWWNFPHGALSTRFIVPETTNGQETASNLHFASLFASQGGKASRSERCFIDPSRAKPP